MHWTKKINIRDEFISTSYGLQPKSNGLHPNSDGLQLNSNGLQPNRVPWVAVL